MPDRRAPRRGLAANLAGLVARAALLVGGVTVAVRLAVPQAGAAAAEPQGAPFQDESGRGRRGVPASRLSLASGHETADMSARLMARVLLGLAAVAVAAVVLMLGFESLVIPSRERQQAGLTPQQTAHPTPPGPGVQADPASELSRQRAAQEQLLNTYARIDPQHARIPISRAMSLIIGHPVDSAP